MSEQPTDIVRPLGAVEEFLWLFDHSSPKHFCLIAEVTGKTTVSDWRIALDRLQERHPILSVCIDTAYNRVPHFRNVTGQPIPLRIADAGASWEREAEREMRTLFDPMKAPLLRTVLILEPERAFVLLVAHHSIADGIATVFLMRDLLSALSGQSLTPYTHFRARWMKSLASRVRTSTDPGVAVSNERAKKCVVASGHVKITVLSVGLTGQLSGNAPDKSRRRSTESYAQRSLLSAER